MREGTEWKEIDGDGKEAERQEEEENSWEERAKTPLLHAKLYPYLYCKPFKVQGAPIKNNILEKMLYFSPGSMDLSQTCRLFM